MELLLLSGYGLLLLITAFSGKQRSAEAFYVNNRAAGAWGVGFSIIVSCVGASATIGMIGMAFAVGTPAFWWLGAGAAGLAALSLALARAVRRSRAYTLPHMTENLLGREARPLIAIVIVLAWTAILAAQFSALTQVLGALTGFSSPICLGLGFCLICCHSLGGQSAIMRVDRLQALVILLALAVMLAWLSWRNPAWIRLTEIQAVNAQFPPEKLVYFLLVVGANYLVCPMLFGRMLSARDERSARLGGFIGAAGLLLCAVLIVAVGLACKGLIPAGTPQDAVLNTVLADIMPRWLHIVVSFALISAIVSSADSCLVTAATVLSFDLLGRRDPAAGRVCLFCLGLGGAGVSLWGKGILGFLLMAYDVFACGVVAPVFVGLMLRRGPLDKRWACAAVIAGGALGAAAALSGREGFSYAGMAVSGLLAAAGGIRMQKHAARESLETP